MKFTSVQDLPSTFWSSQRLTISAIPGVSLTVIISWLSGKEPAKTALEKSGRHRDEPSGFSSNCGFTWEPSEGSKSSPLQIRFRSVASSNDVVSKLWVALFLGASAPKDVTEEWPTPRVTAPPQPEAPCKGNSWGHFPKDFLLNQTETTKQATPASQLHQLQAQFHH